MELNYLHNGWVPSGTEEGGGDGGREGGGVIRGNQR